MIRTTLWIVGGLVLGTIIHLAVILSLPALSATTAWDRVMAVSEEAKPAILEVPAAGEPNPLRLDPELAYAVCRLDLRKGPGTVSGTLPRTFWSVAVYNRVGTVLYSTTNRDDIGTTLDLGLFNAAQTRLLAEQKLDVAEGLLIVEAREDDVFVLIRLAPSHPVTRARYEAALGTIRCGNIAG